MRRLGIGMVALLLAFMVCGCSTWERNTFNTLASAQAVINTAKSDYNSGAIPKTKCAADIINEATAADSLAVNAMVVYEQEKAAGGSLSAQQTIVEGELASLGPVIAEIGSLKAVPCTTPPSLTGGK
jgi:dipeptide/tripeptide permease